MSGTVGSTGHKLDIELADGQYSEVVNLTLVQTDPSPDYLQGNSQNPKEKAHLKISGSDLSVLTPGKKDRQTKRQQGWREINQPVAGASLSQSNKVFLETLL